MLWPLFQVVLADLYTPAESEITGPVVVVDSEVTEPAVVMDCEVTEPVGVMDQPISEALGRSCREQKPHNKLRDYEVNVVNDNAQVCSSTRYPLTYYISDKKLFASHQAFLVAITEGYIP